MAQGWHRFVSDLSYFHGDASYRIDAYSEFMPPFAAISFIHF
jgi:hypothetical protein